MICIIPENHTALFRYNNKVYEYSIQKGIKLTMDKIYRISCKIANGHDTVGYYRAESKKQLIQYLEQNNIHYDKIVNIHVTDISGTENNK